ncbi:MAG: hypothetical protein Kow0069_24960 [Promethearchaeota archaeon]
MKRLQPEPNDDDRRTKVLFDARGGAREEGAFSGAFVAWFEDPSRSVLVADNAELSGGRFRVRDALVLGFGEQGAFGREATVEGELGANDLDYLVRVGDDVVERFVSGTYAHHFFTLSFIHTAGVLKSGPDPTSWQVNHAELLRGEILARPVARFREEQRVTFADALVVDQAGSLVFYDGFSVKRNYEGELVVEYEDFFTIDEVFLEWLLVVGSENLKK